MTNAADLDVEDFERLALEAQALTFLPRATELQVEACKKIDEFLARLATHKKEHIAALDEGRANNILAMELSLQTVRAELQMWIDLKGNTPEIAWENLISAQVLCEDAIAVRRQIGVDTGGLANLAKKLLFIENFVFPPQVFNSVGGVVDSRECSICGGDYETCGHIKGRAYMGEFCHTIIRKIDLLEVSIVKNPANKLCRITHFSDQGKMRNKMTWRLEDKQQS